MGIWTCAESVASRLKLPCQLTCGRVILSYGIADSVALISDYADAQADLEQHSPNLSEESVTRDV